MSPRAKASPALSLILAAFVAWPANIPLFTAEAPPPGATGPGICRLRVGPSFGRADRDSPSRRADLALVAGDLEELDDPDGSRMLPFVPGLGAFDLPSLVPAPWEGRRIRGGDEPARSQRSSRLRC